MERGQLYEATSAADVGTKANCGKDGPITNQDDSPRFGTIYHSEEKRAASPASRFRLDMKRNHIGRNEKNQRWVLGYLSGSLREAGGINPLRMARTIRERIASLLLRYVTHALEGDEDAAEFLKRNTGISMEVLKVANNASDWQLRLRSWFDKYVKYLHKEAQKTYDSDAYCRVKWINCLPTFQTRFGVPAFRIGSYLKNVESLETLRALYKYFYLLYLDAHCSEKCHEKWQKLFPNKAKAVEELDIQLGKLDAYEDIVV
mmetsp:Transcript_9920/g.13809  ORF Transcript_9920/g.13809 Transcript_9920/m.13809 type:complete len:260 (+) Transcript_9920:146-925(+)